MVLQAGSLCGSVVSCGEGDDEIPCTNVFVLNGDSCDDWTVFFGSRKFWDWNISTERPWVCGCVSSEDEGKKQTFSSTVAQHVSVLILINKERHGLIDNSSSQLVDVVNVPLIVAFFYFHPNRRVWILSWSVLFPWTWMSWRALYFPANGGVKLVGVPWMPVSSLGCQNLFPYSPLYGEWCKNFQSRGCKLGAIRHILRIGMSDPFCCFKSFGPCHLSKASLLLVQVFKVF